MTKRYAYPRLLSRAPWGRLVGPLPIGTRFGSTVPKISIVGKGAHQKYVLRANGHLVPQPPQSVLEYRERNARRDTQKSSAMFVLRFHAYGEEQSR